MKQVSCTIYQVCCLLDSIQRRFTMAAIMIGKRGWFTKDPEVIKLSPYFKEHRREYKYTTTYLLSSICQAQKPIINFVKRNGRGYKIIPYNVYSDVHKSWCDLLEGQKCHGSIGSTHHYFDVSTCFYGHHCNQELVVMAEKWYQQLFYR